MITFVCSYLAFGRARHGDQECRRREGKQHPDAL